MCFTLFIMKTNNGIKKYLESPTLGNNWDWNMNILKIEIDETHMNPYMEEIIQIWLLNRN